MSDQLVLVVRADRGGANGRTSMQRVWVRELPVDSTPWYVACKARILVLRIRLKVSLRDGHNRHRVRLKLHRPDGTVDRLDARGEVIETLRGAS